MPGVEVPALVTRCDRCGMDRGRIADAQRLAKLACENLAKKNAGMAVSPSVEFESGIAMALDWVLGNDPFGFFAKHVDALRELRRLQLLGG